MSETQGMDKRWLFSEEACNYLGIKPPTLYKWVKENRIPVYRIDGSSKLYFKRSELDQVIEAGRVETKDEYLKRVIKED